MLAEVSDKMMSFPTLVVWNIAFVLVTWALVKKSRWLALIPFPLATLFALGAIEEWRDPYIGPAVIGELGYGYLALDILPFCTVVTLAALKRKNANPAPAPQPASSAGERR